MPSSSAVAHGRTGADHGGGSRAGRIIAVVLAVAVWALFVALARHVSREPVFLGRYSNEYATLLGLVLALALAVTTVQVPRVRTALYRRRHALVWFLVCCPLIAIGITEGSMRLFNLWGSDFYADIRQYMDVLVLDSRLGFRNPADYHGQYHGFEIVTNAMGLRDRPVSPPVPGVTRILVLGDSVAFGWGVNVNEAFPRQLEHELAARTHERFETINSGVPGYNTTQEETFLKLYDARLKPDAVLLLYVDNDIDALDPARVQMGVMPDPMRDPLGVLDYFLSRSRVYFMLRQMIPGILDTVYGSPTTEERTRGWQESMASIRGIAAFCHQHGLPLAVFHFRMLDNPVSHQLNNDLRAQSRADGFVFADTLPWFRGRNYRRLTNSFIDSHPNAAGHRILADGMTRVLLEDHVVPVGTADTLASRSGGR